MTVHYIIKEFASTVHQIDDVLCVSIDPAFITCTKVTGEIIKIKTARISYFRTDDFSIHPVNEK